MPRLEAWRDTASQNSYSSNFGISTKTIQKSATRPLCFLKSSPRGLIKAEQQHFHTCPERVKRYLGDQLNACLYVNTNVFFGNEHEKRQLESNEKDFLRYEMRWVIRPCGLGVRPQANDTNMSIK